MKISDQAETQKGKLAQIMLSMAEEANRTANQDSMVNRNSLSQQGTLKF